MVFVGHCKFKKLNVNLKELCGKGQPIRRRWNIFWLVSAWTGWVGNTFDGEGLIIGPAVGALSYKTIARLKCQDLREHQEGNPSVANGINVWSFSYSVFQARIGKQVLCLNWFSEIIHQPMQNYNMSLI